MIELSWEERDLLRRGVEALESISASLEKMNRLTETHQRMSDFEQKAERVRQSIKPRSQ